MEGRSQSRITYPGRGGGKVFARTNAMGERRAGHDATRRGRITAGGPSNLRWSNTERLLDHLREILTAGARHSASVHAIRNGWKGGGGRIGVYIKILASIKHMTETVITISVERDNTSGGEI